MEDNPTYWYMSLYPNNSKDWEKEEELLKEKSLIGISNMGEEKPQVQQFKNEITINDIVLIKRANKPIALVKVVGEFEDIRDDKFYELDWFRYRRKVEILDIVKKDIELSFKIPPARFSKSKNITTNLYKYIDNWYKQTIQENYNQEDLIPNEYKIKSIYINNNKILKNFELNLFDKEDKPLPIVVIGGKNGMGKTTLLEYLSDYNLNNNDFIEIFKTNDEDNIKLDIFKLSKSMQGVLEKKAEYRKHIEYLPIEIGKIDKSVEQMIINRFITRAEELDSFKKSLKELQEYITKIFEDLDLTFNISKVIYRAEEEERKVFFKNSSDEEFDIDSLSTGERTLVSKVLYLYFKDIKNKVILIDEPELSLHPSWQNRVLKLYEFFAKNNNCQIIIATHSPHIISSSPYRYLRFLVEENGQIVSKKLTSSPLDSDINTIIKTIMGADVIPKELEELHNKYRKLFEDGKIDSDEAKELKNKILEYESINSSFFQGIKFDMELMQ